MKWIETWAFLNVVWMIIGFAMMAFFIVLMVAGAVSDIRERKRK